MSAKTVAILQSNYIPWKGYFDIIAKSDHFLLYDEVRFNRHDWRNRNQVKTPNGLHWLTIPIFSTGKYEQIISEAKISDPSWRRRHWENIRQNYRHASCFKEMEAFLSDLFERATSEYLSEINFLFLSEICRFLGIKTRIESSIHYDAIPGKTARLVDLCQKVKGTKYLSGPAAENYLDTALFAAAGIEVEYMDYSGYRTYRQLHGEFVGGVSIVDLLLNEGKDAGSFLKHVPAKTPQDHFNFS